DAAIRNAPRAWVQSPSGLISDQRVLLEGWHLQCPGDKGRHVLCLPNCDLVDETWKKNRFPFAVGKAKPQTAGLYVNGAAFDAVPYQRKINGLVARVDEGQQAAHGYWLVDTGAKLQAKNLGARPRAVVEQSGGRPAQFYTPQVVQQELYEDLRWWVEQGRHKADLVEMEQEAKTIGQLSVETASEIDLQVTTSGIDSRTLRWSEIGLDKGAANVGVYAISSLPSEPAGRANEIDDE